MSKKVKVGIIGCGAIGKVHADAYLATGETEIVALCDADQAKLAALGKHAGVDALLDDYRQLLASKAEAVSVCVPNSLHAEMAIAALEAGKHVLLEKPVALNAPQAGRIVAAAEKAETITQVGMVWRHSPQARVIRDYVEAGHFGDIYHLRAVMVRRRGIPGLGRWFTTKAVSGGGPMIDLGVHWFDIAMFLSGLWQPRRVSAQVYAKFGPAMGDYRYVGMWAGPPDFDGVFDVEDCSTGFARFDNGATLSFEIAWAANAESESFVEIMGDKAGARIGGAGPLKILTEHQGRLADIAPQFDEKVNRFETQARSFLAACRGEAPPAATIQQGHTVMKLIDAIYASSEAGREVQVD